MPVDQLSIGKVLAVLYAHQGGWDEILMVAGPILVVVGLLRVAERRAKRNREDEKGATALGNEEPAA